MQQFNKQKFSAVVLILHLMTRTAAMRTTIPMAPSSNYSCHIFRQQGSLSPFFKTSRSSHQVNLCSSIFKSRNLLLLKGGFQPKTSTSLEGSLNEIEYKNGLFINEIPKDLSASYFPLSNMLKVLIGIGSFSSGMLAIGKLSKVTLTESILKKVLVFTVATLFTATTSVIVIQDLFFSPSRVSTSYLSEKGWLPSTLSNILTVQPLLPNSTEKGSKTKTTATTLTSPSPLSVHFLLYKQSNPGLAESKQQPDSSINALYFNHGFGASSLSWLPAIPSLVNNLNAKIGIAHDAPGFGFTERPDISKTCRVNPYSLTASAGIGMALFHDIMKKNLEHKGYEGPNVLENKKIGLFGHSMGSITTLKMALQMPLSTTKNIILVSPAILFQKPKKTHTEVRKQNPSTFGDNFIIQMLTTAFRRVLITPAQILFSFLAKFLLELPFQYTLKRMVSSRRFWKNGLSSAWGDPNCVTDDTILRYRWPSVGKDWEKGLISFSKAQFASMKQITKVTKDEETCVDNVETGDNMQLLRDVLNLPKTTVTIIHGTKDKIVPLRNSELLAKEFANLRLIPLDGQGHDPFEEKVDEFLEAVNRVYEENDIQSSS